MCICIYVCLWVWQDGALVPSGAPRGQQRGRVRSLLLVVGAHWGSCSWSLMKRSTSLSLQSYCLTTRTMEKHPLLAAIHASGLQKERCIPALSQPCRFTGDTIGCNLSPGPAWKLCEKSSIEVLAQGSIHLYVRTQTRRCCGRVHWEDFEDHVVCVA